MSARSCALICAALALAAPARAHDGPPYPIAVDEPFGTGTVSIWADPDVGTGTFYLYLDPSPPRGAPPGVSLDVAPLDGSSAQVFADTVHAEEKQPYDLVAEVPFASRGDWNVHFVTDDVGDGSASSVTELSLLVEVTPPGLGRIDLIWFLSPFLAVAFLWIKVVHAKRARMHASSSSQ